MNSALDASTDGSKITLETLRRMRDLLRENGCRGTHDTYVIPEWVAIDMGFPVDPDSRDVQVFGAVKANTRFIVGESIDRSPLAMPARRLPLDCITAAWLPREELEFLYASEDEQLGRVISDLVAARYPAQVPAARTCSTAAGR